MVVELPRVFTVAHAARLGFTPGQVRTELRRGRWRRLGPSVVLTRPELPTRHDWALAGIAFGGPSAALSGWDAARCFGVGAPTSPAGAVLILVATGRNRIIGGVHLRVSQRPLRRSRSAVRPAPLIGVPVVTAARAVCDTALAHTSLPPVRAMVIACVQCGLCRPQELEAELDAGPRNGSGFLRRAIEDVHRGVASIAEAEAVDLLRAAGVTGYVVNAPIRNAAGVVVFVAS